MNWEQILIMRNEILLVIAAMLVLCAEILTSDGGARAFIRNFAVLLFAAVTVIGFLPITDGSLFGDMFISDGTRILMKNVLNIGVLIVFIQSAGWLKHDNNKTNVSEYFILLISTLIGMDFMISSGDFLMFYIGLELATIPIAALAALERYKNQSAEAGIKLILISALSSGILLYGISMIYGTTGTIYFSRLAEVYTNAPLQILAFIFFFSGMAFKISIVPFHLWAPDVYEGAPVNITSYLSVISKGAAVFIFTIILFTVFRSIAYLWKDLIYIAAIITMTVANLFAIRQNNLKRFLAFSSISQAGYILVGIISGNELGMATVIYYILVYIFSNLGAFGVISVISNKTGKETITDYNGLYRTNPLLTLTLTLALFSLAGIPPVAGFFGKLFLFYAAASKGYYILVIIALINTIIALYYYLLVVKAMWINKSDEPIHYFKSDAMARLGLLICIAGIVVVGFASAIFEYIKISSFGM
jgi:NADH-quinone oxidoreductase subunit N